MKKGAGMNIPKEEHVYEKAREKRVAVQGTDSSLFWLEHT